MLRIEGKGRMTSYTENNQPWNEDKPNITTILIEEGVTSIGDSAFYYCSSMQQINISDSVTSIGEWAFSSCSSLKQINIPANSIEKFKKMLPGELWDILKEEDDERNLPF